LLKFPMILNGIYKNMMELNGLQRNIEHGVNA